MIERRFRVPTALLKAKGTTMLSLVRVLEVIPWFAWIPIVAIIAGTISSTISSMHRHSERMAMIRMGIHPDAPSEKPYYEEQEV